jgi:hypothetical protein
MPEPDSARSNLWTVIAVAVVAYATCDMTHEVLGHGVACLLTGIRPVSLSTVALQTSESSRVVAAAGSIANAVVGMFALVALRRGAPWDPTRFFLWLFAATNLLNGTGYLLFSGVLGIGDWAVVIARLEPHVIWRGLLAVTGALLYVASVRSVAAAAIQVVRDGLVDRREIQRLVFPAYVAGGLLLVAGSALNPIGPRLILTSGMSAGFGAMAGLALVPGIVGRRTTGDQARPAVPPLAFSAGWTVGGAILALAFVFVLGPGVRLP